jgi:hypothetical protein
MKSSCVALLTVLAICCLYGQSQLPPIVLTSKDVDKNSVRVITSPTNPKQNLVFHYIDKSSAEIQAIARIHPRGQVMKDGVVVAETVAGGCGGYLNGTTNYVGLVLIFSNYEQAKLAEKALRGD